MFLYTTLWFASHICWKAPKVLPQSPIKYRLSRYKSRESSKFVLPKTYPAKAIGNRRGHFWKPRCTQSLNEIFQFTSSTSGSILGRGTRNQHRSPRYTKFSLACTFCRNCTQTCASINIYIHIRCTCCTAHNSSSQLACARVYSTMIRGKHSCLENTHRKACLGKKNNLTAARNFSNSADAAFPLPLDNIGVEGGRKALLPLKQIALIRNSCLKIW